jgi:hypothetical protein
LARYDLSEPSRLSWRPNRRWVTIAIGLALFLLPGAAFFVSGSLSPPSAGSVVVELFVSIVLGAVGLWNLWGALVGDAPQPTAMETSSSGIRLYFSDGRSIELEWGRTATADLVLEDYSRSAYTNPGLTKLLRVRSMPDCWLTDAAFDGLMTIVRDRGLNVKTVQTSRKGYDVILRTTVRS